MWQESDPNQNNYDALMTDVVFRIECPQLFVDHASALSQAVCNSAPLLKSSKRGGIHAIRVAGSQNGWERPENATDILLLSKRTRFRIRIEIERAESLISSFVGQTLDIDGFPMQIISGQIKPIIAATTLLSHHTCFDDTDEKMEEGHFIDRVIEHCRLDGFSPTKIMCGKEHRVNTSNGLRLTRSVLLADVPAAPSLKLQDNGLGLGRKLGFGLLIPHKDTAAVHESTEH